MREKGFDIIISSDIQYEELCAEIYFDKQFVAIITQEGGIENAIVEIEPQKNMQKWTFGYSEFVQILKEAYRELDEMKKIDAP